MADRAEIAAEQSFDPETVRRLCGDVLDATVAAIIETGASLADLEAATTFLEGQDDVMGEERRPLSGAAAEIYELLVAERADADDR